MAAQEAERLIAVCHRGESAELWMFLGAACRVVFLTLHLVSRNKTALQQLQRFPSPLYLPSDCPVETLFT